MTQMQKAKHTPGPWTVGERDLVTAGGVTNHVGPLVILGGEGECLVATVETANDETGGAQAAADARLLAAAPDLLAACERLLDRFEFVVPRVARIGNDLDVISAARSAIERAS